MSLANIAIAWFVLNLIGTLVFLVMDGWRVSVKVRFWRMP